MSANLRTGRRLGFDPEAALDRATEVFWTLGMAGATTVELERATGLSRSSLHNTFGTKDELVSAVLDRYVDAVDRSLLAPIRKDGTPEGVAVFFERLADLKRTAPGAAGCVVVNLSAEAGGRSPIVTSAVERYRMLLSDSFAAALGDATPEARTRNDNFVASVIAINWTARAVGPQAAVDLAAAAAARARALSLH